MEEKISDLFEKKEWELLSEENPELCALVGEYPAVIEADEWRMGTVNEG